MLPQLRDSEEQEVRNWNKRPRGKGRRNSPGRFAAEAHAVLSDLPRIPSAAPAPVCRTLALIPNAAGDAASGAEAEGPKA